MSYVVKVGEYYVKNCNTVTIKCNDTYTALLVGDITLSKEMMRGQDKELAEQIAKATAGKVIEFKDEVTNE